MKKNSFSFINNFYTRIYRNKGDQVIKKMISTSSYNYLMNNLSGGMVLPYNIWSISPTAMMVIINHILINNIKTIVEFGTGVSTIFLNNLSIKNNLDLNIISVDHDLYWQNIIRNRYKADRVDFIHAPLTTVMKFNGNEFNWYDVSKLNGINKSNTDFIIIDGPIGNKSPYERAGAMEFFKNVKDKSTFSCFLDDTNQDALKDVMCYYFPDAKFYTDFGIAGSGLLYEIDPVLFLK